MASGIVETAGWHVRGAFESNEVLEWRWEAAFLYECMPTLMMDVDAGSMLAGAKCIIPFANVGRRLSLSLSESPSMLPSSRLFPLSSFYFEFIINCVSSASIITRYGSRRSTILLVCNTTTQHCHCQQCVSFLLPKPEQSELQLQDVKQSCPRDTYLPPPTIISHHNNTYHVAGAMGMKNS